MLSHIVITNFAIVDRLELDFRAGMSALTGETGAGKSILVDALGLVLGDRAGADLVRHGTERADIAVSFEVKGIHAAQAWLREHELDDEDGCLLRRTIGADGRSRAFINGSPSPLSALRELGELLVDIHGQHEHQSLLRPLQQREMLDDFGDHGAALQAVAASYDGWREADHARTQLTQNARDREARIELLDFQVRELDALEPREGELDELEHDHAKLANAQRIQDSGRATLETLYEGEHASASALLGQSQRELENLAEFDSELQPLASALNEAAARIDDTAKELRRYLDNFEHDPARLQAVEDRLGALLDSARKHRVQAEQLPEHLASLRTELDALRRASEDLSQLDARIAQARAAYQKEAAKLSKLRAVAATDLAKRVTDHMQQLGMAGGRFEIELLAQRDNDFSPGGMERVEFRVSANPGQPLKALNKVASGGELSRISLAIQVASARTARIPTLVFDEVDVGIGGGVAEIVGQQLKSLGAARQVLCVTHLPQVAAQADHHYQVAKSSDGNHTQATVTLLNTQARREEIARMLGGVDITKQTLAHAGEMLQRGQALNGKSPKKKKAV